MPNDTNANDDSKNNYSNAEENDQEDITDVVTEVEKPELEVENSQIVNENAIENQSSDDKGKISIFLKLFLYVSESQISFSNIYILEMFYCIRSDNFQ